MAFSNQHCFRLSPIFFVYEDRKNIADLIVETYSQLTVSVHYGQVIMSKLLWEKTDHYMTDNVSQNLEVVSLVAEIMRSDHKPNHLLCKSHMVKKLDNCNIDVLASIKTKVDLQEKMVAINPTLKPFFRGKEATVLSGIMTILKLVT